MHFTWSILPLVLAVSALPGASAGSELTKRQAEPPGGVSCPSSGVIISEELPWQTQTLIVNIDMLQRSPRCVSQFLCRLQHG